MVAARKSFTNAKPPAHLVNSASSSHGRIHIAENIPPAITRVIFGVNATSSRSYDFGQWYGLGFDVIVLTCQRATEQHIQSGKLSLVTLSRYCTVGLSKFFDFCKGWCESVHRPLHLADIQPALIEQFVDYLARRNIRTSSQYTIFQATRGILAVASDRGLTPPINQLFKRGTYRYPRHRHAGAKPLSEGERERFVMAVKPDLIAIFKGEFAGLMSEALAICFMAICLRAGRNTTPMLEISRDALRDHPFLPNLRLLATYKARSHSRYLTPLQQKTIIEKSTVISLDAVAIFNKVKAMTQPLTVIAPDTVKDRLWLYRCEAHTDFGKVKALTDRDVRRGLKNFIVRHNLQSDDGKPLVLTTSRLRKTLLNRLWRLSGGDPFAVACLGGHSIKVMDEHYLLPTPEMERNHKFLGEALVAIWREKDDDNRWQPRAIPITPENTPVGRCRDPLHGGHALGDGTPCIDFLSCFHCRSYVITEDESDLHRLYSFYWFMVRERDRIGKSRWTEIYGWIVRMIDEQVTQRFNPARTARIKSHAHDHPHPFWEGPAIQETGLET